MSRISQHPTERDRYGLNMALAEFSRRENLYPGAVDLVKCLLSQIDNDRAAKEPSYDALHAEAEALRAENGRLVTKLRTTLLNESELASKLDAARRLLREIRPMIAKSPVSDWFARRDALLTATPAPEVLAEQGERQEAIGRIGQSHGCTVRFPIWNTEDGSEPPAGTMLYTTPQPGPDVRPLVEALEQIQRWDGFPPTGKFWEGSGKPMSYSACYGSNGERDFMRNVAANALSAHHQTQQGGSNDT